MGKLTTSEFIGRARKAHGDKYDYSKVVYKNIKEKVTIICPNHGEFEQEANSHARGVGCPKCAGNSAITTSSFIEKAEEVHGSKYDYSSVVIVNSNFKVKIICPVHGEFVQSPSNHVHLKQGCKKCGIIIRAQKRRSSRDIFIEKAKEIHGDKYIYDLAAYNKATVKVLIACREHGYFEQTPNNHLNGQGCPDCGGTVQFTNESFIKKSRSVHGDLYDYSDVAYKNKSAKVKIICKTHGVFEQEANSHLRGVGCPRCAGFNLTTDEIVSQFRKVHGNKYDYSHMVYNSSHNNIKIVCQEHGVFEQTPAVHKSGSGCQSCASYGFDVNRPAILYYLRVDTFSKTFWKIGITNRTVGERFIGSDMKRVKILKVWQYDKGREALDKETMLLNTHCGYLYAGDDEPLLKGGNTELFTRDVLGLDKDSG